MTYDVKESTVWPVNELGELVIQAGVGTRTVTGFLPAHLIPTDPDTKFVAAALPNQYPLDSAGNVIGLPTIENVKVTKLSRSHCMTFCGPSSRYNTTANASPHTCHVQTELEGHFLAVRILVPNADTNTIANTKVAVAAGGVLGIHTDADVITPSGAWVNATFSGSATGTLAAGTDVTNVSFTATDWIALDSVVRTDSGERPVLHVRVEHSGVITRNANSDHDSFQVVGSTARVWRQRGQAVSGVTTTGNFTSNTWSDTSQAVIIQYITINPSLCSMGVGDSIWEGSGPTVRGNGWGLRACAEVSTMARPVGWCNQGIGSASMASYAARMSTFLQALGIGNTPNVLVIEAGSPNSASGTLTASEVTGIKRDFALCLRNAAAYAPDASIVVGTWIPENEASNDYGSTDSLRRDYNVLLTSGNSLVLDIDGALDGVVDADGQTQILIGSTDDDIHPNQTGNTLVKDLYVPILRKMIV